MYSFVSDSKKTEGIEVLVEATSDFPVKIRHLTTDVQFESNKILELLFAKWKSMEYLN